MASRRRFLQQTAGVSLGAAVSAVWGGAFATSVDPAAIAAAAAAAAAAANDVLVWDGVSGTTGREFNAGAQVPWRNDLGDWLDARGTRQGSVPYASLDPALGTLGFVVTPLVRKWYAQRNTGLIVTGTGTGARIWRRQAADPNVRPRLELALSDGRNVVAPCRASGLTNMSSTRGLVNERYTIGKLTYLVLQFDLPALPAGTTVANAVLKLTCDYVYVGASKLSVYELDPPHIGLKVPPQPGLAAAFRSDRGIEQHPDVYFASTLTDKAERAVDFPEWSSAYEEVVHERALGVDALHVKYIPGRYGALISNHQWSRRVTGPRRNAANGLQTYEEVDPAAYLAQRHPGTPSELYFRYYVKLKTGYQCDVEGKKLPGLAGRYGRWGTKSYLPVTGNGGGRTTGTYNGDYLSGWSMRCLAGMGPRDANPYKDDVVPLVYAYHVNQRIAYGDHWRWGTHDAGFPVYEPDRWHCVEQRVRVNSVSGPFDQYGNGTGNPDGILEVWFDGVKVYSRSDVVYRRHPAIKIDEVWLDNWHGGTIKPEREHPFALTGVVVARKYIGPMNTGAAIGDEPPAGGGEPAPTQPTPAGSGALDIVTPANAFDAVNPGIAATALAWTKIVDDFSGGVFNPHFSANGALVLHGGGHAATFDNSVVVLDFDDLRYKLVGQPSAPTAFRESRPDPLFDVDTGEYGDGRPASAHTYDMLAILPPEAGGGTRGSLVRPCAYAVHPYVSANTGQAHAFDFASGTWSRYSTNRAWSGNPGGACAYDPKRKRLWWHASFSNHRSSIFFLDAATREHGRVALRSYGTDIAEGGGPNSGFMAYDPARDIVLVSWNPSSGFRLCWADPDDPAGGWTPAQLSARIPGARNASYPMTYVPELDRWFAFVQADPGAVYEIAIPADPRQTWTVFRTALPNGQVLPTHPVTGKRWTYVPALKAIAWWANTSSPLCLYRPAGL